MKLSQISKLKPFIRIYEYMRKRPIIAEEISPKSKGEHGGFAWTVLKFRFYFSKRVQ